MSKHLYLIGNGFDIHHGINSSYRQFKDWMYKNYIEVISSVEEIYGFCDEDWWCRFEEQLASLNAIEFGEQMACEHTPDLMSEQCDRTWHEAGIEVEQELKNLYSNLRVCFRDWIRQLNSPSKDKIIKIEKSYSVFINFNYTKTLEDLYGIDPKKVLHIHGCIGKDEKFILGHGKSEEELWQMNKDNTSVTLIELSENDEMELFDDKVDDGHELHEQLAISAAITGVASQRKPVDELIKRYMPFFETIKSVEYVHVYGLSMSDIDMPYFKYFASKYKSFHWEFSDYKYQNKMRIEEFCSSNDIHDYSIINLGDIKINKK